MNTPINKRVDEIRRAFRQHTRNGLMSDSQESMTLEEAKQALLSWRDSAVVEELRRDLDISFKELVRAGGSPHRLSLEEIIKNRIVVLKERSNHEA